MWNFFFLKIEEDLDLWEFIFCLDKIKEIVIKDVEGIDVLVMFEDLK